MDPGRQAMIEGRRSPSKKGITGPRHDPNTRISKPSRLPPAEPKTKMPSDYMTEDEQARRFIADEDKFVLRQAKKKADIRVREDRAKPVDFLAFNLRFIDPDRDIFDDEDADVTINVPSAETILEGLGEDRLQELKTDMVAYDTLE